MYPVIFGENPLFPSADSFEVVERVGAFGRGVISYKSFLAGDLIAEFTGDITPTMTQHTLQIEPGIHLLDLYFTGYFLHSCDPNVSVDMKNRRVVARRNINPNDFLEMDYAETEHILFKQFPCSCGAVACRKWITGSREEADQHAPGYQNVLETAR